MCGKILNSLVLCLWEFYKDIFVLKITPYNFNTLKTKQNPAFGSRSTDILKGWKKYSSGILKPNDCDLLDLRKSFSRAVKGLFYFFELFFEKVWIFAFNCDIM